MIFQRRAHGWTQIAHLHAEKATNRPAALEDLEQRVFHIVGGNRETHTLEARIFPIWRENRDVDADDLAAQVDQWATGISRVDGGVGLEKIALVVG